MLEYVAVTEIAGCSAEQRPGNTLLPETVPVPTAVQVDPNECPENIFRAFGTQLFIQSVFRTYTTTGCLGCLLLFLVPSPCYITEFTGFLVHDINVVSCWQFEQIAWIEAVEGHSTRTA